MTLAWKAFSNSVCLFYARVKTDKHVNDRWHIIYHCQAWHRGGNNCLARPCHFLCPAILPITKERSHRWSAGDTVVRHASTCNYTGDWRADASNIFRNGCMTGKRCVYARILHSFSVAICLCVCMHVCVWESVCACVWDSILPHYWVLAPGFGAPMQSPWLSSLLSLQGFWNALPHPRSRP